MHKLCGNTHSVVTHPCGNPIVCDLRCNHLGDHQDSSHASIGVVVEWTNLNAADARQRLINQWAVAQSLAMGAMMGV